MYCAAWTSYHSIREPKILVSTTYKIYIRQEKGNALKYSL